MIEEYRFIFAEGITEDTTLYAVWYPDVTTFSILKTDTDETAPTPLAGTEFTLERLQAVVTGRLQSGYTYELTTDGEGNYLADGTFPTRSVTTDDAGGGSFENLPAGYYRLTERQAPAGYQGLEDEVILYAPYGSQPELYDPTGHPNVAGQANDGDLTVTVRNIFQYSVTIDAPPSLTITIPPRPAGGGGRSGGEW